MTAHSSAARAGDGHFPRWDERDDDEGPAAFAAAGMRRLAESDPELYGLLEQDLRTQSGTLAMIAATSIAPPEVLACAATPLSNITAEGYPGRRFHAGTGDLDEIERLAVERAKELFGARYANVQPHSGSAANLCVYFGLLSPGDTILGLDLDSGGHLTHGSPASVVGRWFDAVGYGLDEYGYIDYDQVRDLARRHRPRLIVCGASAYPRTIDFRRFREIADEAGAYLLADISHISGLVAAGEHPSPVDHAHITTTSTYKQLSGPRGGLILMGRDADEPAPDGRGTLMGLLQRAVFPMGQGTPNPAAIAAKARAFAGAAAPEFKALARRIVVDAHVLADCLGGQGYRVLTGGTDNHMVIIDVLSTGLTGTVAEQALESCGIVVNKNRIPGDTMPAQVASGLRLGTNTLALRGLGPTEMPYCAELLDTVLHAVEPTGDRTFELPALVRRRVRAAVGELCDAYPIPAYAAGSPADAPAAVRGL